jgi:hypothetical protein
MQKTNLFPDSTLDMYQMGLQETNESSIWEAKRKELFRDFSSYVLHIRDKILSPNLLRLERS